ncbi:MAG: hypothetical protein Q8P64_22680, partial [Deltaproteobacteria bacterium]|nr:hypothetical protein [Deltaproteobacteria bacterium]
PCKLTPREYQNLLHCSDEEVGKWLEAAWAEQDGAGWRFWKWEPMDLEIGVLVFLALLLAVVVFGMIGLDIFGIPWR